MIVKSSVVEVPSREVECARTLDLEKPSSLYSAQMQRGWLFQRLRLGLWSTESGQHLCLLVGAGVVSVDALM